MIKYLSVGDLINWLYIEYSLDISKRLYVILDLTWILGKMTGIISFRFVEYYGVAY